MKTMTTRMRPSQIFSTKRGNQYAVRRHLRMFMSILRTALFAMAGTIVSSAHADGVPQDCSQLIVAIAPDWNSMHGRMQLFERARGNDWTALGPPAPVLFGKNGLAWAAASSARMNRDCTNRNGMD